MMKRLWLIVLCLASVCFCTACQKDAAEEKPSETADASAEREESSEPEPVCLLDESFGKLYSGTTYYLETDMTVESTSSPDTSSRYHLTIAVDKAANQAMLLMNVENGSENHIIIRDGQSYNLNDADKTYTVQSFEDSIDLFARLYTADLYLGVTEPLTLTDTGDKKITLDGKEKTVTYEEYRMAAPDTSAEATEEAYVTYCFDNGKPCQEVLETVSGKTTFVFRQVTDHLPGSVSFTMPDDYRKSG